MIKGLHKDSLQKIDNPHQWMIDDARMKLIQQIKAEIERRIKSWQTRGEHSPEGQGKDTCVSRVTELTDLLSFLDTLQEQPVKTNIVEDLKHYLAITPKEQIEKDWESLKEWGKVGPTVSEFLGWKQPVCEELGDEIDRFRETEEYLLAEKAGETDVVIARHFYELGKQSKPEVCEGLEEEIKSFALRFYQDNGNLPMIADIASHFAKWGAEHLDK